MRIPKHPIANKIIASLERPLLSISLKNMEEEEDQNSYLTDPWDIHEQFGKLVDLVIDGGIGETAPTTLVDCTSDSYSILREGKGELVL